MEAAAVAQRIETELRAAGRPQRAERERRYLKSELRHYGASVPAIRATVKATLGAEPASSRDEVFALVAALWARPVHECRSKGDFERFARYADALLDEREFFIRKAIGWVLRETARQQPDRVYAWLEPRAHRAPGVTIREAVK